MLAPINTSTGDDRRMLADGITTRTLPLALQWQRSNEVGHDTAVVIGSLETIAIATVADAITDGLIGADTAATTGLADDTMAVWGSGELFDDLDPVMFERILNDVNEAKLLLSKGIIGPSVDAGAAEGVYVRKGEDKPLTSDEIDDMWIEEMETGQPAEIEFLFTKYEIAAATLVVIPAFAQCQPFELLADALTAAVRSTGWTDLPLADRDLEWDGTAAERRIADDAGIGSDTPDWPSYAAAFLYQADDADPETKQAYGFQIVDLVDGARTIVPRAVFAVAGVLQGARGGTTIPQADQDAMQEIVTGLYQRMADEFDDDTIIAPWDTEAACNPGGKKKKATSATMLETITAATRTWDLAPFAPPQEPPSGLVKLTVTAEGRVYGHIATHDVCHLGIPGVCMTAPVDLDGYDRFHRYQLPGADGEPIAVGRITYGAGAHIGDCQCCRGNDDHACNRLSMGGAIAHHDRMATVAWVRAFEDPANNAIWVTGQLADGVAVDQVEALARGRVSGDWRAVAGDLALVEILTLSRERPGFPLPRGRMAAGQMMALTAAGTVRTTTTTTAVPDGLDYAQLAQHIVAELSRSGMVISTEAPVINAGTVVPDDDVSADDAAEIVAELGALFGEHDRVEAERIVSDVERMRSSVLRE